MGSGTLKRWVVEERGGEDPRPPGHILLLEGLRQQPEVEAVTVADDDRGSGAGGASAGRALGAAGLAVHPLGEGPPGARAPHLLPQLLLQPLKVSTVRIHQAQPGPVKMAQELDQDPRLVGAAGHRAEEGREPGPVGPLGVLGSMAGLGGEAGLPICVGTSSHPCSVSTNALTCCLGPTLSARLSVIYYCKQFFFFFFF